MAFDLIILSDLYTNSNNLIEILSISDLIDCLANVLNDYLLLVESGVFWGNQKIKKKKQFTAKGFSFSQKLPTFLEFSKISRTNPQK